MAARSGNGYGPPEEDGEEPGAVDGSVPDEAPGGTDEATGVVDAGDGSGVIATASPADAAMRAATTTNAADLLDGGIACAASL